MAVLASTALTWADLVTKQDADGKIGMVAEILNKHNCIMKDGSFITCNKGTEHETLVRAGLPSVAWMNVGGYATPSKSATRSQKFVTGFARSISQVPQDILDLADDEAAVRLSEAGPHLESMAQEFEGMFFNGNTGNNPKGFDGMAAYYNALPVSTNNASNQVITAGGSGSDNTSIWLVRHGEQQTSLLVPKNIPAGVQREDKGQQRDDNGTGGIRYVQEELFTLHSGVSIKDYRANARVCNIDVSDAAANSVDIMEYMVSAWHRARMPKHNWEVENAAFLGAKACWYMNSTLFEILDKQSRLTSLNPALQLSIREIAGEEVTMFRGLPIRVTDGITNTEAAVA